MMGNQNQECDRCIARMNGKGARLEVWQGLLYVLLQLKTTKTRVFIDGGLGIAKGQRGWGSGRIQREIQFPYFPYFFVVVYLGVLTNNFGPRWLANSYSFDRQLQF